MGECSLLAHYIIRRQPQTVTEEESVLTGLRTSPPPHTTKYSMVRYLSYRDYTSQMYHVKEEHLLETIRLKQRLNSQY